MASSVTIYNSQTGEKKTMSVESARYFLRAAGGLWSTVPPSGSGSNKWDELGSGDPILNQNAETTSGVPGDAVGKNISISSIQGLYSDGLLGYQEAYSALLNAGVNDAEAGLLLSGRAPESQMEQWETIVYKNLVDSVTVAAREAGFADPASYAQGFVDYYRSGLNTLFDQTLQLTARPDFAGSPRDPNNPSAMGDLISQGLSFLNMKWGWGDLLAVGKTGGGGGGGGLGSSVNVRDRYDIDALARRANEMWQSHLLDEAPNPRQLAQTYIDQIASNPAKALDFESFVKRQMEATPMWKMVYQNKPDGVSPEMYMGFYANRVLQTIGVGASDASALTRSQAAMGSSPDALAGRLQLHKNVQQSAGFLGQLEQKARSAREVLGVL